MPSFTWMPWRKPCASDGLTAPAEDGLRFPGPASHSPNSYILQLLQQDPLIYANFLAFPRLYRHVRLDTIQIKKNQPELFCKRLENF